jgi:hypothetical protein
MGVITTNLLLLISPQPSTEHIVVYLLSTSGISISKLALFLSTFIYEKGHIFWAVNSNNICPICKMNVVEHSELQDKICRMITIKQFANNSPGFDVQFRPFFDD